MNWKWIRRSEQQEKHDVEQKQGDKNKRRHEIRKYDGIDDEDHVREYSERERGIWTSSERRGTSGKLGE